MMLVKTFKWHKVLKYLESSTEGISGGAAPIGPYPQNLQIILPYSRQ